MQVANESATANCDRPDDVISNSNESMTSSQQAAWRVRYLISAEWNLPIQIDQNCISC